MPLKKTEEKPSLLNTPHGLKPGWSAKSPYWHRENEQQSLADKERRAEIAANTHPGVRFLIALCFWLVGVGVALIAPLDEASNQAKGAVLHLFAWVGWLWPVCALAAWLSSDEE